ncbi:hypothetical protein E2C01_051075 [Portunus trituberculatus]|uniref:Uncharacterized protein n=1 Tax=Portunus trituberculatus TaxID=210409 RepID=A0A5B7GAM1_PORTR|nr:hypothetical protein [Portunus trituberculatus]
MTLGASRRLAHSYQTHTPGTFRPPTRRSSAPRGCVSPLPRAPTSRLISGEIFPRVSWDSLAHRRHLTKLRSGTPNRSQAAGGPLASLSQATGVGATTTLCLQ